MNNSSTIMVTGAAGFIGSCLVGFLNEKGYDRLILVDDFSEARKAPNLENKRFSMRVERDELFAWLDKEKPRVDFVFHIGARTDTTEFDYAVHERLNVVYSQQIWAYCSANGVPLVYASSAATYGNGELGYSDSHHMPERLHPMNPYGVSKNEFDKWALLQEKAPPFWAGLKFFNVYGPNEYHKGRMASVIWHTFRQVKEKGSMKLFRSHRPDVKDGFQLRDFIYVKDILKVAYWLMENQPESGLYNLGTGEARAFLHLAEATFRGMGLEPNISFIDMPEDLRDTYQYFTEADMHKLRNAGYTDPFYRLEDGVDDYVRNYLMIHKYI